MDEESRGQQRSVSRRRRHRSHRRKSEDEIEIERQKLERERKGSFQKNNKKIIDFPFLDTER